MMTPEAQAAIWLSCHKALDEDYEVQSVPWGHDGRLQNWDRLPQRLFSVPSKKAILAAACEAADVSWAQILGERRHRRLVRPRQIAIYLIHKHHPREVIAQIGLFMGGRNHSTIREAIRRVPELRDAEPHTDELYHEVERRLSAR